MIKISIDWQGKKGLNNLIRYIENNTIYFEAQELVFDLAQNVASDMQNTIQSSGYNLDKLANSILAEALSTTGGVDVGIGRISNFPLGSNGKPYWEAFDAGFKPGASGTFVPLGGFGDGKPYQGMTYGGSKWFVGKGKYTFLDTNQNKKVIEPLDFIGKAIHNLDRDLRTMMETWGEKFIGGAEKASK